MSSKYSSFRSDLNKEAVLGKYLDSIYPTIMDGWKVVRESDINKQHAGIDLTLMTI